MGFPFNGVAFTLLEGFFNNRARPELTSKSPPPYHAGET